MAGYRTILRRHCPGIGIGVRQGCRAVMGRNQPVVVARPIVTALTMLTLLTMFLLVKLLWLTLQCVFLFVPSCLVRHGHGKGLTLRVGVAGAWQTCCSSQPLHGQRPKQQADDGAAPERGFHGNQSQREGGRLRLGCGEKDLATPDINAPPPGFAPVRRIAPAFLPLLPGWAC